MLARCRDTNSIGYADYGGRGITVCSEWQSFEGFFADMGDRPAGHSIERRDASGNYEPGNCVWLPLPKQARNTRKTVWVQLDGERMSLADAAERLGRPRSTVWGWVRKVGVPSGIDLVLTQ